MNPPNALPLAALLAADALTPLNRRVYDYWHSLRRGGALPSRADFHPARIRFALPRLAMIEVRPGQGGQFRLVGTAIVAGLGFDPTGNQVSRITPPHFVEARVRRYDRIVDGQAVRNRRRANTSTGRVADWQELFLPFGDQREDGSRQVLLAADFAFENFGERCSDPAEVLGPPLDSLFVRL